MLCFVHVHTKLPVPSEILRPISKQINTEIQVRPLVFPLIQIFRAAVDRQEKSQYPERHSYQSFLSDDTSSCVHSLLFFLSFSFLSFSFLSFLTSGPASVGQHIAVSCSCFPSLSRPCTYKFCAMRSSTDRNVQALKERNEMRRAF